MDEICNVPFMSENNTEEGAPDEAAEEVREKHEKRKIRRERIGDILIIQITICIIILLIVVTADIIRPGTAMDMTCQLQKLTVREPEQLVKDAVNEAVRLIYSLRQ